ncbi:hypothetical protein PHPALM_30594 [Phytophthora palmivora]|uniref:Uncharacterized protein n=1 Tax=Phytophthora palmivora TaxID=4796 RepID=A0A2P4X4S5_9STRA|nr:hypothetical protein PHPALM_30594 [Phytophthora palmivora]
MSPTIRKSGEYFPRRNGSNFPDSTIVDSNDDQDLKHSRPPSPTKSDDLLSDTGTLPQASSLGDDGGKRNGGAAQLNSGSSSGASSDYSSGNSSEAIATDTQS